MFYCTNMKFFIKDFCSKCDQIPTSCGYGHTLLKKSSMENVIFCALLAHVESVYIDPIFGSFIDQM